MIPAKPSPDESRRLSILRDYQILDTLPEKALDDIVAIAAHICETPIALISLVDENRQWFKAKIGLEACETARDVSFCGHALSGLEMLIVPDAKEDERFSDNPLVTGELGVRFYAGVPLISVDNVTLGTLCIIDHKPRQITEAQKETLRFLARQVMTHLELRRQMTSLRQSEERFFNTFSNASIGLVLQSLDGACLKANEAFCQLLGYSEDELCRKTVAELTHHDDIMTEIVKSRAVLNAESTSYKMEKRYIHKSGKEVSTHVSVSLMRDKEKSPLYFISQILDAPEMKETMGLASPKLPEGDLSEKIKNHLLSAISHEIRNPLNGVMGMATILAETRLNKIQRECVASIQASGESLLAAINDILDFAKIESGSLKLKKLSFNLEECIEEAFDIFVQKICHKQIEAVYFVDPKIPTELTGDPIRLRQILVNLIGNAVKYTNKGEISLKVECTAEDESGYHLCFALSDTGIGIEKEIADRFLNSFPHIDPDPKPRFGATGFGLAICNELTARMGGKIWIESTPGKGSTVFFSVVLPSTPLREGFPSGRNQEAFKSSTALIVDDNATCREYLQFLVQSWGMTTATVASGQEALSWLAKNKIDVVITDLAMPDMDGISLAKKIRADRSIPILLLSSTGKALRGDDAKLFRFQISKPVKHSTLLKALMKIAGDPVHMPHHAVEKAFDSSLALKKPLRILLAEDNAINQKVGLLMLSRFGYEAKAVANGKRALEAVSKVTYDLILMDIQMPEMNGLDAARAIRERFGARSPVIVALTAEALEDDEERFLRLGFDGYLSKPLQALKLQQLLKAITPLASIT